MCRTPESVQNGEKEIARHVQRVYSVDDLQYIHELGALLAPP